MDHSNSSPSSTSIKSSPTSVGKFETSQLFELPGEPITPVPRVQATSDHDGFNFSRDFGLGWLWDPDDQGVLGATVATDGGATLFFAVRVSLALLKHYLH